MISESQLVIIQFRASVLETNKRLGGVILLESIPVLQARTGTMASIRPDARQVIYQLKLSAGARGRTGSGGLCLWQEQQKARSQIQIWAPRIPEAELRDLMVSWRAAYNGNMLDFSYNSIYHLLNMIWFQWVWQSYLSDCVTVRQVFIPCCYVICVISADIYIILLLFELW